MIVHYRATRRHRPPDVFEQHQAIGAYLKERLAAGEPDAALAKRLSLTTASMDALIDIYERNLKTFWPLAANPDVFNFLKDLAK